MVRSEGREAVRGLTPLERECLLRRKLGLPYQDVDPSRAPAWDAHCATGRARIVSSPELDCFRYVATDLGLLALRVCPVGEP